MKLNISADHCRGLIVEEFCKRVFGCLLKELKNKEEEDLRLSDNQTNFIDSVVDELFDRNVLLLINLIIYYYANNLDDL